MGRSDKLLFMFNGEKFDLVESTDMQEAGRVLLNTGRHRAPLYVRLKAKKSDQELIVILNHLARGDADFHAEQGGALRCVNQLMEMLGQSKRDEQLIMN